MPAEAWRSPLAESSITARAIDALTPGAAGVQEEEGEKNVGLGGAAVFLLTWSPVSLAQTC